MLGDPSSNQGFLPQLKELEDQLLEEIIGPEEADLRLNRLEGALETMVATLDKSAEAIQMTLDDVQQTTLASVLGPLRKGMEDLFQVVHELPVEAPWPDESWINLGKVQGRIAVGYRALGIMMAMVRDSALRGGLSPEAIKKAMEEGRKP